MAYEQVDTSVPQTARIWNYWLGGTDNFPVDREVGDQIRTAYPQIVENARASRAFLVRAVGHVTAAAGIRQFLDVGTGLPTADNTHEVAQRSAPESRIVYVDYDPLVLSHARALLTSHPGGATAYIDADFTKPEKILTHPDLQKVLDLTQPVGLLMIAVLMLVRDADDPWTAVRTLMDALPAGSYLAITHPGQDFDPAAMAAVVQAATAAGMTLVPRERADVQRFFADWEVIDPGVVPVMTWHPDGEPPADPHAAYYWAGLARKP